MLDLLGEVSRRAQDQRDLGAGDLLEAGRDLLEDERQVTGSEHRQRRRRRLSRCGGGHEDEDQRNQEAHRREYTLRPHGARRCWTTVSPQLTRKISTSNRTASAMAASKLPLLVSSTIAVVSVRVCPLMLPPTISEAPISEMTAPKPAMIAASIGKRASRSTTHTI